MKMKLRKSFLIAFVLICLFGTMSVSAEQAVLVGDEQIENVYDYGALLTENEISDLNKAITEVERKTNWNIFALTTTDTDGKTSQEYADDFYDEIAPDTDGLVLLLDMDNRQVYISTSGDNTVIRYMTDDRISELTETASVSAGDGAYANCLNTMLEGVERFYEAGIPSNQYNYNTQTGEVSEYYSITPIEASLAVLASIGVGAILFGALVAKCKQKARPYQYDGYREGILDLKVSENQLVNSYVTHHRKQQSGSISSGKHSSSSSGRSSTHTSRGGHSHGGGGHSF